jgi:two-component system, OmpR family, phosphate regulon sensor histidine kinase PhoR
MTLRSPIFRKLLASAICLVVATLLALDFYLSRYMTGHVVADVEHRLEAEADVLGGELRGANPPAHLEEWALDAGGRAQARVTLIDPRGVVLADSQHEPDTMENHALRPEILEARGGMVGRSIRHSPTLNRELCYVAIPLDYQGKPGYVLRLAVPLEDVDAAVSAVRWRILWASVLAALLSLLVAYLFSHSFTQRIGRLRAFAEGLVDAKFSETLEPRADDELGALARSLNRMAVQLRELVTRLSLESTRREAILASMVEGVLAVDKDLRVTFCNGSFTRSLNVDYPISPQIPLADLVRAPTLREMLAQVLQTGELLRQRVQLPGAESRTYEVQAAPLAAVTGRGAIAIFHDITEIERLERIRRDFVANVSHELRTPLTAIRGYAETLLEGALEDKENNRRFLEIIHAHSIRLNNIASDLLTLSELESGKSSAEPERVAVRGAVESAMRSVEPASRLLSVRISCGIMEDLYVRGDRVRLEQALVNLLDNAVKFNRPQGEVRVEVQRADDHTVSITVVDNGIGIPSEEVPRIFERFYRVDKARSRAVGGTGLGLSIVKHIIDRMNGTIQVDSQLGKGSAFMVFLPAC